MPNSLISTRAGWINDASAVIDAVQSPDNWGPRGGMPASKIDLGFKIDL
jgi:hypothetical protein